MGKFQLSKDVYIKTIALRISDVEKMIHFYKNVLGFVLKLEENNLSILGLQENDNHVLILEETDITKDKTVFFERKICFSLLIPTEAEFCDLLRRITDHNYPIDEAFQQDGRKSIFLKDPEGNELEICYQEADHEQANFTKERLDMKCFIQQGNVLHAGLSKYVCFDRVNLRVKDKKKTSSILCESFWYEF